MPAKKKLSSTSEVVSRSSIGTPLASKRTTPAIKVPSTSPLKVARRLRVLVADDNRVNQMLAVRLLEKMGHAAVVADDGREALAAVEEQDFDIVLMDVQMPNMDGFEATAIIRKQEAQTGGRLPIIALTANALQGDRERCLDHGMDDYVSKPIKSSELHRVIEELMSQATVSASS